MKIFSATAFAAIPWLVLGTCQAVSANDIPPGVFLFCEAGQTEKQETHVAHDGWCYRIELACVGLEIGDFGMTWQPQYNSWGINYAFVATDFSGGCGAIIDWQVLTEKWAHKCEFADGKMGEAEVKSVAMKHCTD